MDNSEELYITTTSGDVILVQIFENSAGSLTLVIGEDRYDLGLSSACDLVESIWSVITNSTKS